MTGFGWLFRWRDRRRPSERSPWARPEGLRLGVVGPDSAVTELQDAARSRAGAYEWVVTQLDHTYEHDELVFDAVVVVDSVDADRPMTVHPALCWLRRPRATGHDVDLGLRAGFDAVNTGEEAIVALAQLDALVRRPPPLASPAVLEWAAKLAARSRHDQASPDTSDRRSGFDEV